FLHPGAQLRCLPIEGRLGRTQEVRYRYSGNLDRVLHRQEQTCASALVDGEREEVLIVEGHAAGGDVVLRVAGDRVSQCRFPRTVGSHDRVDLATADRQVDPLQDLLRTRLGVDRNAQITNSESG